MQIYYTNNIKFNPGDCIKFKPPLIEKNLQIETIEEDSSDLIEVNEPTGPQKDLIDQEQFEEDQPTPRKISKL